MIKNHSCKYYATLLDEDELYGLEAFNETLNNPWEVKNCPRKERHKTKSFFRYIEDIIYSIISHQNSLFWCYQQMLICVTAIPSIFR